MSYDSVIATPLLRTIKKDKLLLVDKHLKARKESKKEKEKRKKSRKEKKELMVMAIKDGAKKMPGGQEYPPSSSSFDSPIITPHLTSS